MKESFTIAAISPFWRWAVCPESEDVPGVPYYREAEARQFFSEATKRLPWSRCYLVRRRWFKRGVEVVDYYNPKRAPANVSVGWMCQCWCDHYWEPEGIVTFPASSPPEIGKTVRLSDGKDWEITSINPDEMEIKVERK